METKLPWAVGAIVLFLGVVFSGIGLVGGNRFLEVGLMFVLPGTLWLLWRNGVLVDYGTRTYRASRGFLPFVQTLCGPFADLDRIRIAREDRSDGEGTSAFWCVCLLWKGNRRTPDDLLVTPDAPRAAAEARRLAAALGLPVDDRSAVPAPSEQQAKRRHR